MRPLLVCLLLAACLPAIGQDNVNLCLSQQGGMATALASAPNFSFSAAKACDGNPDTGWVSWQGELPVWLRVEWRYAVQVREVSFTGWPQCPLTTAGPAGAYVIETLDGGTWRELASGDASATVPGDEVRHELAAPVTTKAVRLLITSAPTGQAAIGELRVMGPDPVLPIEWAPKWQAKWIWCEPSLYIPHREPERRYFRRSFEIEDPAQIAEVRLLACAFDRLNNLWVNNRPALSDISYIGGSMRQAKVREIPADWLVAGQNVLAAEVDDIYEVGSHALLAELHLIGADGSRTVIATDDQWLGQADPGPIPDWRKPGLSDNRWVPCTVRTWPNTGWHWAWNVPMPTLDSADKLKLVALEVQPQSVKPGGDVALRLSFECTAQVSRDYAVVVRLGEPSYWRDVDYELWGAYLRPEEVTTSGWGPGRHEVTLTVPVPDYAPSPTNATLLVSTPEGAAGLACELPGVSADEYGVHFALDVDRGNPPAPEGGDFPQCEVRDLAGNPTLHINGEPVPPILWSSSYGGYERFSEYSSTGVKLFRVLLDGSAICAPGEEEQYYPWWLAQVDRMMTAAVRIDPAIRLIPAVWMDPSPQWLFDDPSEQMLGGRGSLVIPLLASVSERGQVRPTFMSQAWRRDGAEGLRRLVEHMRAQPYAPSVIGVCLFAGRAGENYWGGNERNIFINEQGRYDSVPREQWEVGDFSMAARRTFRDFLMRKYGTNRNLQQAWRNDDVSFDDIIEPARFDREQVTNILTWADKPEGAGSVRDPLQPGVGTLPMDYYQCFAEAMIDSFDAWGRAVKQASDGRLITGCFYGYAIAQLYTAVPGFAGHTAVARAGRSEGLDFFVSPSEYNQARRPGGPYWGLNIIDSLRLHNKLWICEQDTRTYLADHMPKTFTRHNTIAVMRRDAACALARGSGWWWYEFATGQGGAGAREWFIDPEIESFASQIKRVYDYSLTLPDRGPSAQIAIFYHGETLTAQDIFAPTAQINIAIGRYTLVDGAQRIGAPFDLYNLADIPVLSERGLLDQYRMCLLLNPFYLTSEERGWLELLKGGGRTLVWLWAPGIAQVGEHLSPERVSEITGIPGIAALDAKATQVCRLTGADHPVLAGTQAGEELSVLPFPPGATWEKFGNEVWPIMHVSPAASAGDVAVLGNWVISGQERTDLAALCARDLGQWRSVYAAVPYLTPRLMRNIARWAGVHVYRDADDIMFADGHFVSIHTGADPATGELHLPRPSPVYDDFERQVVSEATDTIALDVPPNST
ncbi:MAG TPA: discoidin domain-containing protein, partial [Armatimonadota bacterium]|nr:discoidin domain-containing protein [Armatimonadota bacterium]